jgi:predicted transglutaminase-like cysteine proteinase
MRQVHNKAGKLKIGVAKSKTVSVAAALLVSCFLPFAIDKSVGYPRDFQSEPASLNQPAVTPPEFPLSRKFDVEAEQTNFEAAGPIDYLSFPRDLPGAVGRVSFELAPVVHTVTPVVPKANSHLQRSPRIAAFYGFPRRLETDVDRISFGSPSLAPMAFVRFCTKYPRDCEIHHMAFRPRPMVLGAKQKAELVSINRDVNRAIVPQANNKGVMQEEWVVSPREGDCNDYAVTKRHQLLARGWPSRSLLLVEVVISSGEHHLVLVVRTRDEDLVLDNLNANVRPVSQVHYQWVRAQQQKNPKFWSTISVARATRVAANAN